MKFSVGYRIDEDDRFLNSIIENKESIGEVYFSWMDFPNGRNIQTVSGFLSPWEAAERQIKDLTRLNGENIRFNLLFNAACYGKDSLSEAFYNKIGDTVDYIETTFNLSSVTTTSPLIGKFIKDNFNNIKVRASVNMGIGSTAAMDYAARYFDGYYLKREYNRNFPKIKELKSWCDENGKELFILANSGCLNDCSAHTFHDSLVAHEKEISEMNNCFHFEGICHEYLKNPEKRISLLRDTSFIRPEEVKLYEPYFTSMKLATRMTDKPVQILNSYISGKCRGNVLEILEPNHAGRIYPFVLDNDKLKSDRLFCDKDCKNCGKCEEEYKNALINIEKLY